MRSLLGVLLVAGAAWADVGPQPAKCNPPATCQSCVTNLGEPDSGMPCIEGAVDAGLARVECTDRVGSNLTEYYCPPGTTVSRTGCGCNAVDAPFALGVLGLFGALRRRAVSRAPRR
jgi:hypothetical protein